METDVKNISILGDFGKSLQLLLDQTFSEKSKQLEEREKIVAEREAKVEHILKEYEKTKGIVKLQVGSTIYHTSADTLLKVKESYFHGLLNPNFRSEKDDIIFIDRDAKVFPYILEYLTYGELLSPIEDIGTLNKLERDAQYYLLMDLKEEVSKRIESFKVKIVEKKPILLKLRSNATATNGSYFNWNIATAVAASHFQHNGSTTVTILQVGVYQIVVQYVCTCSTNGQTASIELYVSGNVVSRVYHSEPNGYQQSRCLIETLPLKANDTIMVMYKSNSNGVSDQFANSMSILLFQ